MHVVGAGQFSQCEALRFIFHEDSSEGNSAVIHKSTFTPETWTEGKVTVGYRL